MKIYYQVHVYSCGDIEVKKVDERSKIICSEDVYIDINNSTKLQEELLDYGVDENRVTEVLKELEETGMNDTIEV